MIDNNIAIQRFIPTDASDNLVGLYLDYRDSRLKNLFPGEPTPDRDLEIKNLLEQDPYHEDIRWVAIDTENVKVVGSTWITWQNENSPSYTINKHSAWINTNVDISYRRQGIGTTLIKKAVEVLDNNTHRIIHTTSNETDGFEYIESLGFGKLAIEDRESRLYLDNVDWQIMQDWEEGGAARAPTTSIVSLSRLPESNLVEFTHFLNTLMNSVDSGEIELEAKDTPETMKKKFDSMTKMGTVWHAMMTREANGELSGYTEIFYNKSNPEVVRQGLTAVLKKYQGKGIGKWLKAKMVIYLRDTYPDVRFIKTMNANENAPMLSINTRMGFRFSLAYRVYKFDIQDFRDRFPENKQ